MDPKTGQTEVFALDFIIDFPPQNSVAFRDHGHLTHDVRFYLSVSHPDPR